MISEQFGRCLNVNLQTRVTQISAGVNWVRGGGLRVCRPRREAGLPSALLEITIEV